MRVTAPVAKTAHDAINAKVSAVHCNYKLVPEIELLHDALVAEQSKSSIDEVIPFTTSQNLYKDLLDKTNTNDDGKIRRQTPLVNAGYAIRVLAISSTILQFMKEKQGVSDPSKKINLVLLGAGLDIMAIWACLIGTYDTNYGGANVQLYEVDCAENVRAKRDALLRSEILSLCPAHDEEERMSGYGDPKIMRGRIDVHRQESDIQNGDCNYTLVSADLRDSSGLEKAFQATSFDSSVPTIVISELVLAYLNLDQKGEHTNELLSFISSHLCPSKDSLFLAYEPVMPGSGSSSSSSNSNVEDPKTNVVEGYGMKYFSQFASKLDRGNAPGERSTDNQNDGEDGYEYTSSSSFAPVGKSSIDVIKRLRKNGFDGIVGCTTAAKAGRYIAESGVQPPELFDEYAALRLHLCCYSIICATGGRDNDNDNDNGNGRSTSLDAKEWMVICPWLQVDSESYKRGSGRTFLREVDGTRLTLTSIKCEHQEQVRSLFKESYTDLMETFPSVRKLVKAALKSDLGVKEIFGDIAIGESSNGAIWNHYCESDGAFWVVTRDSTTSDAEIPCNGQQNSTNNDLVVGCVGVKKCDPSAVSNTELSACYEINRLAVLTSDRGNGIGRMLLQCVEEFVRGRETTNKVGILASTPKVLDAANSLYFANGFRIDKESTFNSMVIRSFVKDL